MEGEGLCEGGGRKNDEEKGDVRRGKGRGKSGGKNGGKNGWRKERERRMKATKGETRCNKGTRNSKPSAAQGYNKAGQCITSDLRMRGLKLPRTMTPGLVVCGKGSRQIFFLPEDTLMAHTGQQ
jgi:hypothetical protein